MLISSEFKSFSFWSAFQGLVSWAWQMLGPEPMAVSPSPRDDSPEKIRDVKIRDLRFFITVKDVASDSIKIQRQERQVFALQRFQKVHGEHCLISVEETPHLDGKHVVFGEVLEGYDEASPLFCLTVDSVDSGWWILDAGCQEDGSSSKSQKSSWHVDISSPFRKLFEHTLRLDSPRVTLQRRPGTTPGWGWDLDGSWMILAG